MSNVFKSGTQRKPVDVDLILQNGAGHAEQVGTSSVVNPDPTAGNFSVIQFEVADVRLTGMHTDLSAIQLTNHSWVSKPHSHMLGNHSEDLDLIVRCDKIVLRKTRCRPHFESVF